MTVYVYVGSNTAACEKCVTFKSKLLSTQVSPIKKVLILLGAKSDFSEKCIFRCKNFFMADKNTLRTCIKESQGEFMQE